MQDGLPVLYSFRRCPYAIRSRMAIAAARRHCELREVLLSDKPAEMLALSAKGTVPVLHLPGGDVIDESLDIMYWALQQADPNNWLVNNPPDGLALIEENDRDFKEKLDRYKYHVRYPEYSQEHYRQRAEACLGKLEERLAAAGGNYLFAAGQSLADIALFPFIRQFARVDMDWFRQSPYGRLQRWLAVHEESEAFTRVMHKYPRWQPGSAPERFP